MHPSPRDVQHVARIQCAVPRLQQTNAVPLTMSSQPLKCIFCQPVACSKVYAPDCHRSQPCRLGRQCQRDQSSALQMRAQQDGEILSSLSDRPINAQTHLPTNAEAHKNCDRAHQLQDHDVLMICMCTEALRVYWCYISVRSPLPPKTLN